MNANTIPELCEILKGENNIYENLIDLGNRKTKILIEGNVEELSRILVEENKNIKVLKNLEKSREESLKVISSGLNLDYTKLNINDIIEKIDAQSSGNLIEIQTKLKSNILKAMDINKQNESLIQNSLEFVEFSMNILSNAKASTGENNYGSSGKVNQQSKKTTFDFKL